MFWNVEKMASLQANAMVKPTAAIIAMRNWRLNSSFTERLFENIFIREQTKGCLYIF